VVARVALAEVAPMTIDVDATMAELHRLMTAEMNEYFEARTPRWYFEMHPELRAALIRGLAPKMTYPVTAGNALDGEFRIFGIPIRPNPMLREQVRLVVGARDGQVTLVRSKP
jgi:hypothetical protein